MARKNSTSLSEFILLGLADTPELQIMLFLLFSVIYTLTVVGNFGMILLIRTDSRLHTPMYFFLANLSFVDICYSSSITPKMLADLLSEKKTISFAGCFLQMYFFIALATTECILFGLMAYDRYVAICSPLLYSLTMTPAVCLKMAAGAFTAGLLNSMVNTSYVSTLSFCNSNVIHHFFCDSPPLFRLSCSDTRLNEGIFSTFAGVNLVGALLVILTSYSYILFSIFRMHSGEGRHKALSTCASHLTAIILFYSTSIYTYLRPSTSYSLIGTKWLLCFTQW
ncbi:PREDICTED: LOW QUALITY PROTEIN: olfactory receptor 5F1-like [Condylura cristata]|uniref:LOW QUALITY PROTEIN: olfactory receptor 5F1-like n=1 Tax=Condylura cristata TaxID=143302 RepID=UPI00064336B3|nr:PREDICTED: LOW QUALITY PROTEIN: olfactory receptor 5F1-like [Condylura cristata]